MQLRRLAVSSTAIVALAGAAFLYASHPVRGSDHQDSPAVVAQPGADITDVFVFPSPANANNVDFVMNVHPLIPARMGQQFSLDPGVLYQFKAAHGPLGTAAPADSALQLVASGTGAQQKITVYVKRGETLGEPSTLGQRIGEFNYDNPNGTKMPTGIVGFAGPRADPFFFDLFQFFQILPDRLYKNDRTGNMLGSPTPSFNGYPAGSTSGPASGNYLCNSAPSTNALTEVNGGFNVVSILLEVPRKLLAQKGESSLIHVWATASKANAPAAGKVSYSQIELLSRPAVKELFEPFAEHDRTNRSQPYNDPTLKSSISNFMTTVAGRSKAISGVVTAVLYPNEIAVDLAQGGPAAYLGVETGGATGGKFGGRSLTDNVIDTSLGVVFGKTITALGLAPDDGKENYCLTSQHVMSGQGGTQTQSRYPYLAPAH